MTLPMQHWSPWDLMVSSAFYPMSNPKKALLGVLQRVQGDTAALQQLRYELLPLVADLFAENQSHPVQKLWLRKDCSTMVFGFL